MARWGWLFLAIGLVACSSTLYQEVSMGELVDCPSCWQNKRVKTTGQITEQISERTYFVFYPYYDPVLEMTRLSISEVVERAWVLSDREGHKVTITDRDGGLYIPMLPYVPAFEGKMVTPVRVWGIWQELADGSYILRLSGFEEASTEGVE